MLVPIGAAGFVLLTFGVVTLEVWPTVFGASLIVLAQLWRIDRLVVFLREHAVACAAVDRLSRSVGPRWPSCRA